MSTIQPRRPAGVPTGGQFASKSQPVPGYTLDDTEVCDECGAEMPEGFGAGPEHDRSCSLHPDSVGSKSQPVPGYTLDDTEVCDECGAEMPEGFGAGPEHDRSCSLHPDSVGRDHLGLEDLEVPDAWRAVGVHDQANLGRLQDYEVLPEDFTSDDRNLRHWAHYVRGDMVFEGELTGNAYEMHRHDSRLDPRSVFAWTDEVYVGGNTQRWDDLSAEDRLDYISGCAEVLASDGDTRSMLFAGEASARQAGRVRGRNIVSTQRKIEEDPDPDRGYRIVDPDAAGRALVVRNVRPVPERDGYEAEVAAGQYRRHHDDNGSRTVPWAEGSRVFFRKESLGI